MIITFGAQGAIYASKAHSNPVHIKTPVVKCVDSTGAGDAFIGALAYLISNRKDMTVTEQIEKSCVVAADSVTRCGTQLSFPGPEVL